MGWIDAALGLLCVAWAYAVGTGRLKVSSNPVANDQFVKTTGRMMVIGCYVMLACILLTCAIRLLGVK